MKHPGELRRERVGHPTYRREDIDRTCDDERLREPEPLGLASTCLLYTSRCV